MTLHSLLCTTSILSCIFCLTSLGKLEYILEFLKEYDPTIVEHDIYAELRHDINIEREANYMAEIEYSDKIEDM